MAEEYTIYTDEGNMFCKCQHSDDGSITLKGKKGSLTMNDLLKQAMDGEACKKTRGKKIKKTEIHRNR